MSGINASDIALWVAAMTAGGISIARFPTASASLINVCLILLCFHVSTWKHSRIKQTLIKLAEEEAVGNLAIEICSHLQYILCLLYLFITYAKKVMFSSALVCLFVC